MRHQLLKERFEEVQEIAQLGFWEWDIVRDTITWSDEIYALFETPKTSTPFGYQDFLNFVHPDDRDIVLSAIKEVVTEARDHQYEMKHRIITGRGRQRHLRERGRVKCDEFGSPLFMIGTVQDITRSVGKEERLQEALDEALLFRELLDKSNDAIYIFDSLDGRLVDCNESAQLMLGYTRQELLSLRVRDIEATCHDDCDWERYLRRLQNGRSLVTEGVHRRKEGKTFPVESSISLSKNGANRVVAIVRDITERKAVEAELKLHHERLEMLVEKRTGELRKLNEELETYIRVVDNNVLTSSTDVNGIITYVSDAFCKTSGYTETELLGNRHSLLRHPDMPAELFVEMWETITGGVSWHGELKNRRKDGSDIWIKMTIEPNFDNTGAITGYTAIRHDISDKKHIEALTRTDPLTGIYNRRFFYEIMDKELRRTVRYGGRLCFAMIDIDFFKNYNDTYGHLEGDKVLVAVTEKMKSLMRRGDDYLFRLGGEEFGIVCHCPDEGALHTYADTIRGAIEGMRIAHEANDISDYVTISMGMTIIPPEHLVTLDEVYEKADSALYRAKENGRNRIVLSPIVPEN